MAAPSGVSSGAAIDVVGLKEFRRALKAMDPEWPKGLRTVHKKIADEGAARSRAIASGMGGVRTKFAGAIRGYANQRTARVGVLTGPRTGAGPAFWGAKRHTGWYAKKQYANDPPQHPSWVGNTWEPAELGQGPYAINEALATYKPNIWEAYFQMVLDLAHDAFND